MTSRTSRHHDFKNGRRSQSVVQPSGSTDLLRARWGLLRESSTISTAPRRRCRPRARREWGLLRESSTISTGTSPRPSRRWRTVGAPSGVLDDFNQRAVTRPIPCASWVGAPSGVLDDFNLSQSARPPRSSCVGAPSGVLDDFNPTESTSTSPHEVVGAPSGVLDDFNKLGEGPFGGAARVGGGSFGSPRRFQRHQLEEAGGNASGWGLLRESSTISTHRSRLHTQGAGEVGAPSGVLDDFNAVDAVDLVLPQHGGGSFGSPRRFQPTSADFGPTETTSGGSFGSPRRFQHQALQVLDRVRELVGAPSGVLDDFNPSKLEEDVSGRVGWGLLRESSTISTAMPEALSRNRAGWGLLRESSTISTSARSTI